MSTPAAYTFRPVRTWLTSLQPPQDFAASMPFLARPPRPASAAHNHWHVGPHHPTQQCDASAASAHPRPPMDPAAVSARMRDSHGDNAAAVSVLMMSWRLWAPLPRLCAQDDVGQMLRRLLMPLPCLHGRDNPRDYYPIQRRCLTSPYYSLLLHSFVSSPSQLHRYTM